MKFPPEVRRRLLRLLNARSAEEADTDELSSVLLQISLAVMLIFMIAFFLFMSKVGGEISRVEDLKSRVGAAEREQILRAVDQVAEHFRVRYGLKDFLRIDPLSGAKSYEFSGVIAEGNLGGDSHAGRAFYLGSAAAEQDYRDPAALESTWMELLRGVAGDALTGKEAFAAAQVKERIPQLKHEVIEVQTLAAAAVLEHLAHHPDQVEDADIAALLRRIAAEPDSPDRTARLNELNLRLRRYVYARLARQSGATMLEEP